MLALSSTLLFTTSTQASVISFQPTTQVVDKVDLKDVTKSDLGVSKTSFQIQYEKDKAESDKKKQELEKQKVEEKNKGYDQVFIVSYYGATKKECGNNHFKTASGVPVQEGHIAVPKQIPFGSKVIIDGVEYIATDRGNPKYIKILKDGSMKVDIFVPRLESEIYDYQYERRIAKMGIKKVVGKLLIKE